MDVRHLIDVKNGTASREIFVDRDVYRQEQEQIFARAWLFVGHECQVPNPDDFYVSRMGEESVILDPRPPGQAARLPQHLPPSRHEAVPLRRGQHAASSVARITRGAIRPTARWSRFRASCSACPATRSITTRSSTSRNGAWFRSRRWSTTAAPSGRHGTRTPRRSRTISAACASGSTPRSTIATDAKAVPWSWSACRSGAPTATGNSRRPISSATPRT